MTGPDTLSKSHTQGILLALGATLIWSGNFIVARSLNQTVPPATLSLLRWATAFLGLLPFAARAAWQERQEIRRCLPKILPTALLGVSIFNTLVYLAAQTSTALNLSLIATSTPIFILLLSRLFLGERLTMRKIVGLCLALLGVLALISGGDITRLIQVRFSLGDAWMSLAALIFAAYSIMVRRCSGHLSARVFLLTLMGVGIIFLLPWAAWEYNQGFPQLSAGVWGAIIYVGLGASLASYTMWNSAIASIGPSLAGLVYYSLPLFSGLVAYAFLGEPVGLLHLFSGSCILGGIIIATRL